MVPVVTQYLVPSKDAWCLDAQWSPLPTVKWCLLVPTADQYLLSASGHQYLVLTGIRCQVVPPDPMHTGAHKYSLNFTLAKAGKFS